MKKFGDMLSRQTHKMMAKMGKAEDTKDPEYEAAHAKCVADGKRVKNIAVSSEKLMSMLQANTVVLKEVIDEFTALVPEGSGALTELAGAMEEVEAARAAAEENLSRDLCIPMYRFYRQYKVMHKRASILKNYHLDMDRFKDSLDKITEKSAKTGNAAGVGEAEQKYRTARESYETLRDEMMVDFERLHNAVAPFLQPAIAVFMREQGNYAAVYGRVLSRLSANTGSIDLSLFENYTDAITSESESAAGQEGVLPVKKPKKNASPSKIAAYGMVAQGAPAPERKHSMYGSSVAESPAPGAAAPGGPAPARPLPPARPVARQERCRALYDFAAEDSTELPLRKGDVITIIKKGQDWWEGECNGQRGLFPGNYVEMC